MASVTLTVNGAPVIDAELYSALVAVVILTTLFTPLALERSLRKRHEAIEGARDPSGS